MRKVSDQEGILNLHLVGESILKIGDFLQFSSSGCMIYEHLTPTDAYNLFKLNKLFEIVCQNSDSEFA